MFAVGDIESAVEELRYYAGWTDKVCGSTVPVDGDFFTYTRLEPVGVCAAILPVSCCVIYRVTQK